VKRQGRKQLAHDLPDDVLLSVQSISRAVLPEMPELPGWLQRILPKSGIAGQTTLADDFQDDEDGDDAFDDDEEFTDENLTLGEISFDIEAGRGLGVVGPNQAARRVLLQILMGAVPPTTGQVLVRGRIAPLLRNELTRYTGKESGKSAVFLAARFLHWPRDLLRERWDQILEFAALDELEQRGPNQVTLRLLCSAALHMDASVYLLDHGLESDPAFAMRCFELIEERQQEGAAVVHAAQKMIDDVSRLCDTVLWFEKDGTVVRGRPVDVAIEVQKLRPQQVHPLSAPILAEVRGSEPVELPGVAEIELHLLRSDLQFTFSLTLQDAAGRVIELEQPEVFRSHAPGLYHLRIFVPAGVLPDGRYRAGLKTVMGVAGSAAEDERELLGFDVESLTVEGLHLGEAPTFELVPTDQGEAQVAEAGVEASVGGTLD
jgi:ABC-type polysaccharide/polyol phosphate transport system ATPase subunit